MQLICYMHGKKISSVGPNALKCPDCNATFYWMRAFNEASCDGCKPYRYTAMYLSNTLPASNSTVNSNIICTDGNNDKIINDWYKNSLVPTNCVKCNSTGKIPCTHSISGIQHQMCEHNKTEEHSV